MSIIEDVWKLMRFLALFNNRIEITGLNQTVLCPENHKKSNLQLAMGFWKVAKLAGGNHRADRLETKNGTLSLLTRSLCLKLLSVFQ